jgi:acyl-CoA synthetase (AMP-forming)/AMP-acid ligase II
LLGESIKADILLESEADQEKVKEEVLILCNRNLSKHKVPQQFEFKNAIKLRSTGKR